MRSRFLLMASVGSLALAGVMSACSSGGKSSSGGGSDGGGGDGCTTLDIYDFNGSCKLSINSAAPSTVAKTSFCVAPGTVFDVVVSPASSAFELGPNPWVVTNEFVSVEDAGNGTSPGEVNVGGTRPGCVSVCCPLADGTGCDPTQSGFSDWAAQCQQ
jgi:hypothetical protein